VWVVGGIQGEQGRSQAGRMLQAGHMLAAVAPPPGLRSPVDHMLAAGAYRRRAVLVDLGIQMRLRLGRRVDRLEERRRPDQHLRQNQSRMLDQRMLSSSCHRLLVLQPAVVRHPAPGRIVGRPGKGWPSSRLAGSA
jgi:hypothetical protein